MKTIPLTQGLFAKVDDEDWNRFAPFKWYAQRIKQYVYAARKLSSGRIFYLHRLILGEPNSFVDHINHDTLDCRKENLRLCDNRQNQWNGVTPKKRSDNPSRFRGVSFDRGKWRSRIRDNGTKKHLGLFLNEIDAAKAYNQAAIKIHGQFARLNVVE